MTAAGQVVVSLAGVGVTYRVRTGFLRVQEFKALEDINLDIRAGETLGVIGANGSGKSTLLKLVAGIYSPDSGSIERHVDKISLLSLSLGFDPELSGYDNAIFSSMLLGATYRQARGLLPDILAFSELGPAAGNPIKTYSSGMRSRLGFAVALYMETDVLLIDEALSVGDTHFRRKSEEAINRKITSNQTVLLVSHTESLLRKLCDRVLWLKRGRVEMLGDADRVVDAYEESAQEAGPPTRRGSPHVANPGANATSRE